MANSDFNNMRRFRDYGRFLSSLLCSFLYIPHLLCYILERLDILTIGGAKKSLYRISKTLIPH